MSRVLLLGLLLLGLTGCKSFSGVLEANETFRLNLGEDIWDDDDDDWDDFPDEPEYVMIEPGQYATEISASGSRTILLKIKANKKNHEARIELPSGVKIPEYEGTIDLKGVQIEQPWDLVGEVTSEVTQSKPKRGFESCSYSERHWVCRDRRERRDCGWEYITRYGNRRVEYYVRFTDSLMEFELKEPKSLRTLGEFTGQSRESETIYLYRGTCR